MKKILIPLSVISLATTAFVITKASAKPSPIKTSTGTVGPGSVPIGGMVAVMPSSHANAWQPPASGAIKDGFMRADGGTVPTCSDCVIPAGTVLPNMTGKYPRGNTTSGTTGGSNTQASNVTFGSASISTSGGGASFNKNVMNTDGINHKHELPFGPYGGNWVFQSSGELLYGSVYTYVAGWTYKYHSLTNGGAMPAGSQTVAISNTSGVAWSNSTVSTAFTNPSFDQNTLTPTNNAVNNEPAYVEVVWVIRVK